MSEYDFVSEDLQTSSMGDSGGGAAGYGSGLIGGILDAFIGPVMANEQFQRSKHVSNRQMAAAQFVAENNPRWAIQGLVNAGLNPILAATRGVAQAQFAPSARTSIPDTGSFARALEGGVSSARQLSLLDTQQRILKEQLKTATNEANASRYLDTKVQTEIGEIAARIDQLEQGVQTGKSQVDLNFAAADASRANARRTAADASLLEKDLARAESERQFYEGEFTGNIPKPMLDLFKLLLSAISEGRR